MGGATANANVRPLPIMHIHGTADDVCGFSGVQPALNVWIKHNGCPTTAKVVNNYNSFNGAKLHTWAPGNDGVEVKLLELPNKGHWVCKEPQVYTGKEMWNFCKKYSLNKTSPNIRITSPTTGTKHICFAPTGEDVFPDITITATADDSNGSIDKVEFYDGSTLIATCAEKPYKATLTEAKAGQHTLKAVATDNDGETSTASIEVTLQAPTTLTVSSAFTEGGALPSGWITYDGKERRVGYSNGYYLGCRVLQFTGASRGLNYGLYFRNVEGKARQGWAKYGLSNSGTTLHLAAGHYTLKYKICNWNKPAFSPVELGIEKANGNESVAKQTFTPTINIGNVASNSFGQLQQQTFEFDIVEAGNYAIALYTADVEYGDCILGQLILTNDSYATTGIKAIVRQQPIAQGHCYDLQGRKMDNHRLPKGLYIKNGEKVLIK